MLSAKMRRHSICVYKTLKLYNTLALLHACNKVYIPRRCDFSLSLNIISISRPQCFKLIFFYLGCLQHAGESPLYIYIRTPSPPFEKSSPRLRLSSASTLSDARRSREAADNGGVGIMGPQPVLDTQSVHSLPPLNLLRYTRARARERGKGPREYATLPDFLRRTRRYIYIYIPSES